MKPGWRRLPFLEAVEDASAGNAKTPQGEFLTSGRYPVVDQGKQPIAGYLNDESRLCRTKGPVIVFGDHTRCFKYVDFPFCIGADGVKVLRPRVSASVRYLYHYLSQVALPDGGYDRHFKYLKRTEVVLPPLPEQERIAEVLDRADALRVKRRTSQEMLGALEGGIFAEMFGDPMQNRAGHPSRRLIDLVDPERGISYGIVQRGADVEDGVPVLRISDVVEGRIGTSSLVRADPAISSRYRRTVLRGGEVVVSIRGTVGRCAAVPAEIAGGNITRELALVPALPSVSVKFLLALLRSAPVQRRISGDVKGIAQRGINLEDLRELPVIQPGKVVLAEFERRMTIVDQLAAAERTRAAGTEELFASLQHRAFSGAL